MQVFDFINDFKRRKSNQTYVYANVKITIKTNNETFVDIYMTVHPFYNGFFITNYFDSSEEKNILFAETYSEYFGKSVKQDSVIFGSI